MVSVKVCPECGGSGIQYDGGICQECKGHGSVVKGPLEVEKPKRRKKVVKKFDEDPAYG